MKQLKIHVAICLGALAGAAAWAAGTRPVAVSPGDPDAAPVIADRCPTFNWGSVEGARAYELVAYRVPEEGETATAELEPLIRVNLPGSAHGWTPALDRCLARSGRYAWSLRARGEDGWGEWSEASFFRVAAAPSAAEVEQALAVLRDYLAAGGELPEAVADRPPAKADARPATEPPSAARGPQPRLAIAPDATAISGELADPTGVGFGLHGISHSAGAGSAGVVGEARASSGEVFGVVGQVASAAGTAGAFDNTAGGDVLRGLVDGTEVFRVDGTGEVTAAGFAGDGSGLSNVAAASADDLDCTGCVSESELDFDPATQSELDAHPHAGEDITSGTVAESRIDAAVARDGEILPTVLANDGAGSTLDADLLDGNEASAFLPAGADAWVDEAGDTMTGTLVLNPAVGNALETSADIVLNGNVHRGGTLFLHADGNDNTALGDSALPNNTIGGGNTAIGAYALYDNTSGSRNTGLGAGALYATTGVDNVAIGYHALDQSASGSANVAIGSYAGSALVAGGDNVLIASPGEAGDSGTIRIGDPADQTRAFIAGISTTTLSGDPVVVDAYGQLGVSSGGIGDADTVDGLDSTELLRSNASDSFTSGTLTTAAGTVLDVDGSFDATGATSLALPAAGISGAGAGSGLDADLLDGNDASAFLPAATDNWVNETGDTMTGTLILNPASGNALETTADLDLGGDIRKGGSLFVHNKGTFNTALGIQALQNVTSGFSNIAIGFQALYANTTAEANVAVGTNALYANTTGFRNTACGHAALASNITGTRNCATGFQALYNNTDGRYNTAGGGYALRNNTDGSFNTATGFEALRSATSGLSNTAVGARALRSSTTASLNTAVGAKALYATTGIRNVGLGYQAGLNATTGNYNIFIANQGVAAESATIRIGTQGTQTRAFIAGISGTTLSGDPVVVDAYGQLGVSSGGGGGDADTLDGLDSTDLLRSNTSDGFTSGTLTTAAGTTLDVDGALDASGATSTVLAASGITGAGSGSGLDADLLDGNEASAFMPAATDNWVDTTGDTMTGTLTLDDIDLGGDVLKGGNLFIHGNGVGNTAIGSQALSNNSSGGYNTAVGSLALANDTFGAYNTAVGFQAHQNNTIGIRNTAVGAFTLSANTSGKRNTAVGFQALQSNTTGWENTAVGYRALTSTTAGGNIAVGSYALENNTGGTDNTAVGLRALRANTTGTFNVAFGGSALIANTNGRWNTAIGPLALGGNASGDLNTALGFQALLSNTDGRKNTASGVSALLYNVSGDSNTAVGLQALFNNSTGSGNVAVGYGAGFNATTGNDNIFVSHAGVAGESSTIRIGTQGTQTRAFIAGISGTTLSGDPVVVDAYGQLGVSSGGGGGDADTLDGLDSTDLLRSNTSDGFTSGTLTTAAGTTLDVDGALDASGATSTVLAASGITGAGSGSGLNADLLDGNDTSAFMLAATDNWVNVTGDIMTGTLVLTPSAGNSLEATSDINLDGNVLKNGTIFIHNTGVGSTGVGTGALSNNTSSGGYNTAVGYNALSANTSSTGNTAVGAQALVSNLAFDNTGIGFRALFSTTTGNSNTAVGTRALQANTAGKRNTAVGVLALSNNTAGDLNTAIGWQSLSHNQSGYRNTVTGSRAMYHNYTGHHNAAIGYGALFHNNGGHRNAAGGAQALFFNEGGSGNTALGYKALFFNNSGSHNVAIGYKAGYGSVQSDNIYLRNEGTSSDSGTIRIGTGGIHTRTFIAGIRGAITNADGVTVVIDSQGQLGTIASSRRFKEDIRDMGAASSRLMELRPVVFRYRQESASGEQPLGWGLIAEEVAEVFPELVAYDDQGRAETVLYHLLSSMLLNELQKQDRRIRDQERRLADQKRELDRLAARLAALRRQPSSAGSGSDR